MREFFHGVYHAEDKAFIDAFICGMIPCKVLRVIEPGQGRLVCSGKIEVEVTETGHGFRKGEVLVRSAFHVVPRDRLYVRGYFYRINTQYEWSETQA